MKLYGSLTSPYVRKVRILIREKDLSCEFVASDAWAADSPIPALNPLGKIPVLALDNGETPRRRYTLYLRKSGTYRLEEHINRGDFNAAWEAIRIWRRNWHDPRRHAPLRLLDPIPRSC